MSLKIKNLSFHYAEVPLFKNLNLEFSKPNITWIRGPSGCGKSTFLKLIAGLLTRQEGEITFSQDDIKIGYVHQECHLIDHWTIEENLRMAQWLGDDDKAEFKNKVDQLFKKFDLKTTNPKSLAKHLSGGERQRVSLMRVLLQNPDIILLDEPTAHLDDLHTEQALKILSESFTNKLVLIVSHDQRVAKFADKTIEWTGGLT